MKLSEFKFLTDENISSVVVQFLRDCQLDVFDVKENLLSGRRDSFLLDLAVKQERVVITQDSDFGTLAIATRQPVYGIVYLKPGHISQHHVITSLQVILKLEELVTPFIVTAKNSGGLVNVRVRLL